MEPKLNVISLKEVIMLSFIFQGLNNDLIALRLMHPYIIDTSVIYNVTGVRWRKSKLSLLSKVFLGEEIQKHGEKGHNPIEDSVAAMKLVNLKLQKGYEFGDVLLGGFVPPMEDGEGNGASGKKADGEEDGKVLLLSAITEIRDQVHITRLKKRRLNLKLRV